jgi:putative membrane protein
VLVQQRGEGFMQGGGLPGAGELGVSLALVAGVTAVGAGYSYLAWRWTRFRVGRDVVELRTGVLNRQQRQARLDRLQAVDVVQPLLARLAGLSELKLEVAGGSGSQVRLSYLRDADARRLRAELLARAAGVRFGESEPPPEAPERMVLQVPVERLLLSLVRSGTAAGVVLAAAGLGVAGAVTGSPAAVLGAFPAVLGAAAVLWQRFALGFSFAVAISPDGLRLRHGLLETRAQTVPPGRVQAVRLTQPLLWRGPDWWRVEVNVAGYGGGSEGQVSENVLLPVGPRSEAVLVLSLVLPDLGTQDPLAVVDAGLSGEGGSGGFAGVPDRARWLDPVGRRRLGYRLTDRALLARSGRLVRRLDVVPHERTQSLALHQGPLQRRLELASVVLHPTPGPVSPQVPHLDAGVAAALLEEQAARARRARAAAGPERWMEQLAQDAAVAVEPTRLLEADDGQRRPDATSPDATSPDATAPDRPPPEAAPPEAPAPDKP